MRTGLAAEDGIGLVELVVVCALLTVVLGATFGVLEATSRSAANDQERSTALVEANHGLHAMTDELRGAYLIVGPTSGTSSNYMDVLVRTAGQARRVLYKCDVAAGAYRRCVRYSGVPTDLTNPGAPQAGAVGQVLIAQLTNGTVGDPVFTNLAAPNGPTTRPAYFQATIKAPAKGERSTSSYGHSIVLDDSVYMRNLDVGR